MIKLSTSTTQTIKFIPRSGTIDSIVLENETTSVQDVLVYTTTAFDNYTEANITTTDSFLQEGGTYTLKALDSSSNVLFYDKVFCTDQTDYTINKDEYKTYSQSETYKTFKG